MRATFRAVLAARRIPRSTPASHASVLLIALSRAAETGRHPSGYRLSGPFRFFDASSFGLTDRIPSDFGFAPFTRRRPERHREVTRGDESQQPPFRKA
jgi:hypothetical protein